MSNKEEHEEELVYNDIELVGHLKRPQHIPAALKSILIKLSFGLIIIVCIVSVHIYSFVSVSNYKYQYINFFQAFCSNKRFSVIMVVSQNYFRELLVNSTIYYKGLEPRNYTIAYLKREYTYIQSLEYKYSKYELIGSKAAQNISQLFSMDLCSEFGFVPFNDSSKCNSFIEGKKTLSTLMQTFANLNMKLLSQYLANQTQEHWNSILTGQQLNELFLLYEQFLSPGIQQVLGTLNSGIEAINKQKDNTLKILVSLICVIIGVIIVPIVSHFVHTVNNEIVLSRKLILLTPFYLLYNSETFKRAYDNII